MDGLLQSINQPAHWVFGKASADGRPTLLTPNRMDILFIRNMLVWQAIKLPIKSGSTSRASTTPDGTKDLGKQPPAVGQNYFKGAMEMKFNKNFRGTHWSAKGWLQPLTCTEKTRGYPVTDNCLFFVYIVLYGYLPHATAHNIEQLIS